MEILNKLSKLKEESISRGIPILKRSNAELLLNKVKELQPKRILELGTANGYSGCILGSEGAELVTIESDKIIASEAIENFRKHGINARLIVGDGVEEVKNLVDTQAQSKHNSFDLIFIDFMKRKYIEVLEDCIHLCTKGGVIIADNIDNEKCADFLRKVTSDKRLDTNISHGMSVSRVADK